MPTFIERPKPEQMLETLREARRQIDNRVEVFICYALSNVLLSKPWLRYTVRYLQDYVARSIAPAHTFDRWLAWELKGKVDYIPLEKAKETRLQWLDWMIAGLEEELVGIKASQAIESAGEQS